MKEQDADLFTKTSNLNPLPTGTVNSWQTKPNSSELFKTLWTHRDPIYPKQMTSTSYLKSLANFVVVQDVPTKNRERSIDVAAGQVNTYVYVALNGYTARSNAWPDRLRQAGQVRKRTYGRRLVAPNRHYQPNASDEQTIIRLCLCLVPFSKIFGNGILAFRSTKWNLFIKLFTRMSSKSRRYVAVAIASAQSTKNRGP